MSDTKAKLSGPLPVMPTREEIAAWDKLSRDEQLETLRAELDHPDCARDSTATFEDIRKAGQAAAERHRLDPD